MQALETEPPVRAPESVFERSRFFLDEHLAHSEKGFVRDEHGRELLFVERPARRLAYALAVIGTVGSFLLVVVLAGLHARGLPKLERDAEIVCGMMAGVCLAIVTGIVLSVKRRALIHRDENGREPLLRIEQDRKLQLFSTTYTVMEPSGRVLARLSRNYLHGLYRARWTCRAPDGRLLCTVREDSALRSLARRVLGPMLGVRRTDFAFLAGDLEIGRLDRSLTLSDRHVLDFTGDVHGALDRRVALAIGVLLDTGEKR